MQSMTEWFSRQPHYTRVMHQQRPKGKRFYVIETGGCEGAHLGLVKKLEKNGQTEVNSEEMCDYYVVFCPLTSRIATDIGEAETRIPDDKPVILVVMHHTFNPDAVILESSRHTTKPNIELTVDCLFYTNHFLVCKQNDLAWHQINKFLGVTEVSRWKKWWHDWRVVIAVSTVVSTVLVVGLVVYFEVFKH